jgi:hypothetical protein
MPANETFVRRRVLFAAKLAGFRIEKSEADIQPVLNLPGKRGHLGIA